MAEALGTELILGGQRSGKSRRAEALAHDWLGLPGHRAWLLATALAGDADMHQRIARHQRDRAARVPGLQTLEVPLALGDALRRHSAPDTLVVVDCLTLWLTNWLMPMRTPAHVRPADASQWPQARDALLAALTNARGPVVLVSNEVGLGVIPLGHEVRAWVDALGRLNQDVAAACCRVTFMAAGLPLVMKDRA